MPRGFAEGKPQAWLDERFVPPLATGDRMHHHEGIDGAETRYDLATRVYAALQDMLAADCPNQVVVSHGFAHTFVGITVLQEDDYFHNRALVTLSDTTHLGIQTVSS